MGNAEREETAKPPVEFASRRGLECFVGQARVGIPTAVVERVIEYQCSPPPPLARRWVGGFVLYEGRVMLSVALVSRKSESIAPSHPARGVVLRVPHSEVGWILEVNSVGAFLDAEVAMRRSVPQASKLPAWVHAGRTLDRRAIGWIDVDAMVRELVGTA